MKWGRLTLALVAGIAGSTAAAAQARNSPGPTISGLHGSAEGQLTVTLTIVPSVGVVMDPDGQPKLMVANAADPADNVSVLNLIRLTDVPPAQHGKGKKTKQCTDRNWISNVMWVRK